MGSQIPTLGRALLLAAGLPALCTATAAAAENVVEAHAPRHARVSDARAAHFYSVRVSGHAQSREQLYMFVDYTRCASSPGGEHAKIGVSGDIWTVRGDFRVRSGGWTASAKGKDHICSYLVRGSAPSNPFTGVLAHDFVTFRVHR
jgi:hypothetical protein